MKLSANNKALYRLHSSQAVWSLQRAAASLSLAQCRMALLASISQPPAVIAVNDHSDVFHCARTFPSSLMPSRCERSISFPDADLLHCLAQDLSPTNISINGNPCSIQLNITLSNVVPNDTTTGVSPLSAEESSAGAKVEQTFASTVRATLQYSGLPVDSCCMHDV